MEKTDQYFNKPVNEKYYATFKVSGTEVSNTTEVKKSSLPLGILFLGQKQIDKNLVYYGFSDKKNRLLSVGLQTVISGFIVQYISEGEHVVLKYEDTEN